MGHLLLNNDELGALAGLNHLTQVLYILGIKPRMDSATGIAGRVGRMSWDSISMSISVKAKSGTKDEFTPSVQQLRRAAKSLQKAGLISQINDKNHLVFECVLATRISDFLAKQADRVKTPEADREADRVNNAVQTASMADLCIGKNTEADREADRVKTPEADRYLNKGFNTFNDLSIYLLPNGRKQTLISSNVFVNDESLTTSTDENQKMPENQKNPQDIDCDMPENERKGTMSASYAQYPSKGSGSVIIERSRPVSVRTDKPTKVDNCPHEEIVALYHEILPMCPAVASWTDKRQAYLRQRWKEDARRQSLDWWRGYFGHVAKIKFLTGRAEGTHGRRPFLVNLEWLVRPTNFLKVIEGNFDER